jgi:GTPase SAR1 family protein
MLQNYIYGAHAVVLAYDITNSASFADLEDWLSECKTVFKDAMPKLCLVGNKSKCFANRRSFLLRVIGVLLQLTSGICEP